MEVKQPLIIRATLENIESNKGNKLFGTRQALMRDCMFTQIGILDSMFSFTDTTVESLKEAHENYQQAIQLIRQVEDV